MNTCIVVVELDRVTLTPGFGFLAVSDLLHVYRLSQVRVRRRERGRRGRRGKVRRRRRKMMKKNQMKK